jgi:hypothetical protein
MTDVVSQLPRNGEGPGLIDQITAEGWSSNRAALKKNLAEALLLPRSMHFLDRPQKRLITKMPGKVEEALIDWSKFYRNVFGLKLKFNGTLFVPNHKPGFDRLLVIAQGMTPQRLFDKCKELFPATKYTDRNLDEIVTSDRTSKNGHYAIWVRDRQEADEENKNLSADFLKERGTPEITLEERELYELKFFKETGDHLDKVNRTLCPGSRYSDGSVPNANWLDEKFKVDWNYTNFHSDDLRSRSVVS